MRFGYCGIQPNFDSIDGIEVEIEISSAGDVTEPAGEPRWRVEACSASGDGKHVDLALCSLR